MANLTRHIIAHGKVQGVFFRDWTVETAQRLEVSGWVRNLSDGTVEILASAEEAALTKFVALLHEGPERAKVSKLEINPAPPEAFAGFERRPTP